MIDWESTVTSLTFEYYERVVAMLRDGKSNKAILEAYPALRTGIVAGIRHRLKTNRPAPNGRGKPRTWDSPRPEKPKRGKPSIVLVPGSPVDGDCSTEVVFVDKNKEPGYRIYQLKDGMCKYPYSQFKNGDHKFCGEPAMKNKSYCEHHCHVAYDYSRTIKGAYRLTEKGADAIAEANRRRAFKDEWIKS
jgi:hypothetical protein